MSVWPYNTREWKFTRLEVLRTNPECPYCHKATEQVHHIVPIARGGDAFDAGNLEALCCRCHSCHTATQDGGFGRKPGQLRIKGCDADGRPLDPMDPWNHENLPDLCQADRCWAFEES